MAAYFGHPSVIQVLLRHGACVNAQTDSKATPLHKAVSGGQTNAVHALLSAGADTWLKDFEGNGPTELSRSEEITAALRSAEKGNCRRKEVQLLEAASVGNITALKSLLASDNPPSLASRDSQGNTPLHHAASGGHANVMEALLQYAVDTTLMNKDGKTAYDLSSSRKIRQMLYVEPPSYSASIIEVKRFEGSLVLVSRFLSNKTVWVVLERGTIKWFKSCAEAVQSRNKLGSKSLSNANFGIKTTSSALMKIHFSDNTVQLWAIPCCEDQAKVRQMWVQSLIEHRQFWKDKPPKMALENFADSSTKEVNIDVEWSLCNVRMQQVLLEQQIQSLTSSLQGAKDVEKEKLMMLELKLSGLLHVSRKIISSLTDAVAVMQRCDEVQLYQLNKERERRRILEEAIDILRANEHGELSHFESILLCPSAEDNCLMKESCDGELFFDAVSTPPPSPSCKGLPMNTMTILDELDFMADNSCYSALNGCRQTLPACTKSQSEFNLWDTIRQCIGQDISQLNLPIFCCEPLSMTHRMAEAFHYAVMLNKAALIDDPVMRMQYVAAFVVASSSVDVDRVRKPFNPLLGETFEFVSQNGGFRLLVEQVSLQPPITALHCEGDNFIVRSSIQSRVCLSGKNIKVHIPSISSIIFPAHDEVYTFTHVNTCVHNIILGKLWIEHCGEVLIQNHANGLQTILNFKPCSWFGQNRHFVEGRIQGPNSELLCCLTGKWCEALYSCKESLSFAVICEMTEQQIEERGVRLLWKSVPPHAHASQYYDLPLFAISLNELQPEMKHQLPPSDSRFRPDIRLMENGDYNGAAAERNRIESKQQQRLCDRKQQAWTPSWFKKHKNEMTEMEEWLYSGGYWECSQFNRSLDLY